MMAAVERKHKRKAATALTERLQTLAENCVAICNTTPIGGRYPAPGFELHFLLGLDWPTGYDDSYPLAGEMAATEEFERGSITVWPSPNVHEVYRKQSVKPYVDQIDEQAQALLYKLGCTNYRLGKWDEGEPAGLAFTLSRPFPPFGFDDEYDEEAKQYYRPMSDEAVQRFKQEEDRPPITDEYWILTRYAGINMARAVDISAEVLVQLIGLKQKGE